MWKVQKACLRQYLNVLPAALITFSLGAGIGWVAPALIYFTSEDSHIPVTPTDISWIASTYFAMEITSPIVAGLMSKKIGRKSILTLGAILITISWITVVFAKSALMVILARAVLGTAAGFHDITWSIYLGEFATPDNRGVLGSIITEAMVGGIVFEFLLSLYVSYRVLAVVPLVTSVLSLVLSFNLLETPQFLLMQNREDEALENFIWFRGADNVHVRNEFEDVKQYIDDEKQTDRSFKHFLKSPSEYKVFIICIASFGFIQLCGNTTVASYLGIIMKNYDDIPSPNNLVFLYGVVQFFFINVSPFIIEKTGRRVLLISGFGLSAAVQAILAFLLYVDAYQLFTMPYIPQTLIVLFNAIGMIYSVFLLPAVYVIRSELFPQELKITGSVASTFCNATVQFISMQLFIPIWESCGMYLNFVIYAAFCICISIAIYVVLPETRGKTLIEIQRKISSNLSKSPVKREAEASTAC